MTTPPRDGLCPGCAHVRLVKSARGSVFLLCHLAARDPRLAKYPPQPRLTCLGYAPPAPGSRRGEGG